MSAGLVPLIVLRASSVIPRGSTPERLATRCRLVDIALAKFTKHEAFARKTARQNNDSLLVSKLLKGVAKMTPIERSPRSSVLSIRPVVRACSSCHGEAGYHANHCPNHDPQTCAVCQKIAVASAERVARSA